MKRSRRFRIALLVLMLAASHVALLSHVTGHFEPALEQCELCVGQSQLFSAVPSPDHALQADPAVGLPAPPPPRFAVADAHEPAYRQRAPPKSSPEA